MERAHATNDPEDRESGAVTVWDTTTWQERTTFKDRAQGDLNLAGLLARRPNVGHWRLRRHRQALGRRHGTMSQDESLTRL